MRWLADRLSLDVHENAWPSLVEGASIASMRAAADVRTPGPRGVFKNPSAFFRRGGPGAGREILSADELAAYDRRVRDLVSREGSADPKGVLRLLNVD